MHLMKNASNYRDKRTLQLASVVCSDSQEGLSKQERSDTRNIHLEADN